MNPSGRPYNRAKQQENLRREVTIEDMEQIERKQVLRYLEPFKLPSDYTTAEIRKEKKELDRKFVGLMGA